MPAACTTASTPCSRPFSPAAMRQPAGTDPLPGDPPSGPRCRPQTRATIGDRLDAKGVSGDWYAGAAEHGHALRPRRAIIYRSHSSSATHQPFNYYAALDPVTQADDRARRLLDSRRTLFRRRGRWRLPAARLQARRAT
ncbi:MAG: hypothetical protein IPH51_20675 [Rubrivivax sp.]|nr:hypothetical protein [Rubrivivax sp.]